MKFNTPRIIGSRPIIPECNPTIPINATTNIVGIINSTKYFEHFRLNEVCNYISIIGDEIKHLQFL